MDDSNIRYFPLDFDSLKKGDEISTEQIEEFGRCNVRDEKRFRLAALQLKNRIVRECRERGKFFTVAVIKCRIRVLTDEQAVFYNKRQFKSGFRRQSRSFKRTLEINADNLSDQQRKELERDILIQGKMLQAARSAKAKIVAVAHQRTTPGLPAAKE